MSQEVIKVAAVFGAQDAFGSSSDILARTTQLELSPNSIRKACQMVGETVAAREQAQHARHQDRDHRLAQKRVAAPKRDGRVHDIVRGWLARNESGCMVDRDRCGGVD